MTQKKLLALDIRANKNNRVTAAQYASLKMSPASSAASSDLLNLTSVTPAVKQNPHSDRENTAQDAYGYYAMSYSDLVDESMRINEQQRDIDRIRQEISNSDEYLEAVDKYSALLAELKSLLSKKHRGDATQHCRSSDRHL